ncbi:MAG: UDP-N-acetylmuramate dehydrogenase [Candidatus Andersenbacteria bacterium]|nr:UDP-N-acetylmuramate dehydrogenase [Candidatus Andersenbacteria bacterium]
MNIQTNIQLAPLTTIQLGGPAQEYISCDTNQDIISALQYAKEKNIPIHVLGGGSNTIFADAGFSGLIIHIQTSGITHEQQGDDFILTTQAGEDWDNVVQYAISHNAAGIECLSGIPGSVGGTPFQNVGAYGQDVSQTIKSVFAINRDTLEQVEFSNSECNFGYRTSRFRAEDKDKYIITAVAFELKINKAREIKYPELASTVGTTIQPGKEGLQQVRNAVLALRKKKSMLIDPQDPNSVSCGSFFTNPIISTEEFVANLTLAQSDIPNFPEKNNCVKLSAGWLIEHSGFSKGMRQGNVGISENHSLALVNRGGTTQELLDFSKHIQTAVQKQFKIQLQLEPIVVL